jgi:hypothetical protein
VNEILGRVKTIQQLLHNTKYSIDYYRREYKWKSKIQEPAQVESGGVA